MKKINQFVSFCRVNMILFDLFFMGFTVVHQLIISLFKISTFPKQFGIKNKENTDHFLKIQLLDHYS